MFLYQSWSKFLKCYPKLWGDLRAYEFFDRGFLFRLRVDVYVELLMPLAKSTQDPRLRWLRTYNILLWFGIMCHFWDVDATTHVLAIFSLA
jgi:hypothetical protein